MDADVDDELWAELLSLGTGGRFLKVPMTGGRGGDERRKTGNSFWKV